MATVTPSLVVGPAAGLPSITVQPIDQVLAQLTDRFGQPLLNAVQIGQLMALTYANSNKIIDLDNRELIFDLVGAIVEQGYDSTYRYLTSQQFENAKQIIDNLPMLEATRIKFTKDLENLQAATNEGLYQCGDCGSENTFYREAQTRSADEATSVKVKCYDCGKAWFAQ